MHVHSSLWRDGGKTPAFAGPAAAGGALPDLCRWWLGGLMQHARACALLFAPTVNSYKRFRAGSFAPTAIAWAVDNRTAGFRIVGSGASLRVECRIPGADANPDLAFAATLAAGLDGIAQRTEPPPRFSGDAYAAADLPRVPATLPEATAAIVSVANPTTKSHVRTLLPANSAPARTPATTMNTSMTSATCNGIRALVHRLSTNVPMPASPKQKTAPSTRAVSGVRCHGQNRRAVAGNVNRNRPVATARMPAAPMSRAAVSDSRGPPDNVSLGATGTTTSAVRSDTMP